MKKFIGMKFIIDAKEWSKELAEYGLNSGMTGIIVGVNIEGEDFETSYFEIEIEGKGTFEAISGYHLIPLTMNYQLLDTMDKSQQIKEVTKNTDIKIITKTETYDIIESRERVGTFLLFEDNGTYTGIDNSTKDAWTENFNKISECINWLYGEKIEKNNKENEEEKIYDGTCSVCGNFTSLIFVKHSDGEPIYSIEKEGLSDLLATSICECGHRERIIIYGKARRVKVEE